MRYDNHRKKAMNGDWAPQLRDGGRSVDTMRDSYYNDGSKIEGNGQRDPDSLDPPRDVDFTRPCGISPFKGRYHGS